jgi:RNA polymerase sigma factor (sigma-70 family)
MTDDFRTYSDAQLFELLRGMTPSREAAFGELYARHSSRIYLYCRKILGSDTAAEDAFQQTFLRFLASADSRRPMTNVPAFLLRIERNICLNEKRRAGSVTVPLDEFRLAVEDISMEVRELTGLVTMAIDLLPEEYREAFVLQAYNGLSYKEIAEIIDMPLSTVRNRIVRAKQKIREILSPYLAEHGHH